MWSAKVLMSGIMYILQTVSNTTKVNVRKLTPFTAADFFVLLLAKAVDGSAPSGAAEGHYILENGTYQYLKLAQLYTKSLHAKGKSATPEPSKFVQEEFDAIPFLFALGTNSTTAGPHSRLLGWKPQYTTDDFYASVAKEVDVVLST